MLTNLTDFSGMKRNAAHSEFVRITTPLWSEWESLNREAYTSYARLFERCRRMNEIADISHDLRTRLQNVPW